MSNAPLAISAKLTTATNRARYLMNSRLRRIEALDAGSLRLFAGLRFPLPLWSDGALILAFLALFAHPRGPARPKQLEEGARIRPPHSITSSARASSVGGTVRPSALAVLRLMISSYFVGCCTGRLDGFSPLRMRST